MSRLRNTAVGRKKFLRAYVLALVAAGLVFALTETVALAAPRLSAHWQASAAFMLLTWSVLHLAVFCLVGGLIVYPTLILMDEYFGEAILRSHAMTALAGAIVGIVCSILCPVPFLPFSEPDDPSFFARWMHYLPSMAIAGAIGASCFGLAVRRSRAGTLLGESGV